MSRFWAFGFLLVLATVGFGQSKGDRYNGVWTVSRGGGGTGRVWVDGSKLKGVLLDSGWFQLTGERRIGQLTGRISGGSVTVNVEWSTGAKVEYRGPVNLKRTGLTMTLDQYAGDQKSRDTQFSLEAHRVGDPIKEPFGEMDRIASATMAGEWSGSFVYGPNRGLAYVTFEWDGSCHVVMANESPNDDTWSAEGALNSGGRGMKLTVNSGFSKQEYTGKFKSIGPDQVQITFDREKGSFIMVLSRW